MRCCVRGLNVGKDSWNEWNSHIAASLPGPYMSRIFTAQSNLPLTKNPCLAARPTEPSCLEMFSCSDISSCKPQHQYELKAAQDVSQQATISLQWTEFVFCKPSGGGACNEGHISSDELSVDAPWSPWVTLFICSEARGQGNGW